jgi:uncharacterized membrane protein
MPESRYEVAFCSKCGTNVNDGVAFCPQCGAAIGAPGVPPPYTNTPPYANTPPPPYPQYASGPTTSGLQENVAGFLSYLLGWLTGIIFLLIDKRPFVRFHAAQSIVVFGALFVIRLVLIFAFVGGAYLGFWAFHALISGIISLITLVAWLVLMVTAYQGKTFEVPIAAGIARSIAGKVN